MNLVEKRLALSAEQRLQLNEQFKQDAEAWDLRYRCCDCIHFSPEAKACSLKYPNHMLMDPEVMALYHDNQFVFCKDFEMVCS